MQANHIMLRIIMSSSNWKQLQKKLKSEHKQMDSRLFTETECGYSEELGVYIASEIINGRSVNDVLTSLEDVAPDLTPGAVYWWLAGGQKGGAAGVLCANYARIREAQAARLGQGAIELIDQMAAGKGDFRHARVALDGMKWITARLDATKWGDNVNVKHSGSVTLDAIVQQAAEQRTSIMNKARQRVIEGETVDSQRLLAEDGD